MMNWGMLLRGRNESTAKNTAGSGVTVAMAVAVRDTNNYLPQSGLEQANTSRRCCNGKSTLLSQEQHRLRGRTRENRHKSDLIILSRQLPPDRRVQLLWSESYHAYAAYRALMTCTGCGLFFPSWKGLQQSP